MILQNSCLQSWLFIINSLILEAVFNCCFLQVTRGSTSIKQLFFVANIHQSGKWKDI